MLAGQLNFGDIQRLPPREEAIVLRAMHQTLVDHGFCLTQETDAGPLLVFPSYFNRERRDQIDQRIGIPNPLFLPRAAAASPMASPQLPLPCAHGDFEPVTAD